MDASFSCYIFEIATMLCSVMHTAELGQLKPFETAGIALKVIRQHFTLNVTELEVLYDSVMGRFCILLVFCGHDMAKNEQTAQHVPLDFNVLERLLEQLWDMGASKWKKLVIDIS